MLHICLIKRFFLVPFCLLFPFIFDGYLMAGTMADLGTLGGTRSVAYGVSSDGTVIVGSGWTSGNSAYHAFKYTGTTMLDIGTLGGTNSYANAISGDGSAIVGHSHIVGNSAYHAFKYTGTTMLDIGTLGGSNSYAKAISGDGSAIAGHSQIAGNSAYHAFKYTGTTILDIGTLGGSNSYANAISGDGSAIVGNSQMAGDSATHAFKYTATTMIDLGTLGGTDSYAQGISGDGTVIVGQSNIVGDSASHAFKYTGGAITDLGTLGGTFSNAYAASANGSVIVGYSQIAGDTEQHAVKYEGGSITDLGTLGGTAANAYGVSADGSVVVGESKITGDTEWHAFVYRSGSGGLVDVENTKTALYMNGQQLNSLINFKSTLLTDSLKKDCTVFGPNGLCVAFDGGAYLSDDPYRTKQGIADFRLAYQFSPKLRAGLLLGQSFNSTNPNNFEIKNRTPLFEAFTVWNANENGMGLQLRLSAAYNKTAITITRTTLANTEAGKGNSDLVSSGLLAEIGYALNIFTSWQVQPYASLRRIAIKRNAYTENSGAYFPITYNPVEYKNTTGIAGLQTGGKLTDIIGFSLDAGMEYDLNYSLDGYSGTIDTLGDFSLAAADESRTRTFATVGMTIDIRNAQQFSLSYGYKSQYFNNANASTVYAGYAVGF